MYLKYFYNKVSKFTLFAFLWSVTVDGIYEFKNVLKPSVFLRRKTIIHTIYRQDRTSNVTMKHKIYFLFFEQNLLTKTEEMCKIVLYHLVLFT